MARKTSTVTANDKPDFVDDEVDETLLTTAPDDWEFETVHESATRVLFDTIGDVFIGQYVGDEHIEPAEDADNKFEPFDLINFRGRDGKLYAVNSSHNLVKAMAKVEEGQWVRITFASETDSKKGNPLKNFTVDVRK